uniref:Uncharacterized protein n=1 Tax=Ditylenchus dipsaci TaxID=166011 RepID=A0A915D6L2_9BILA
MQYFSSSFLLAACDYCVCSGGLDGTFCSKNWIRASTVQGSENRRGIMRPPMFAHSLWNVYDRTLNGDHRANNYAEAANHRIQTELDVCHPGLWNFIECLKSVQQGRDQKYLQWEAGKRPRESAQSTSKPTPILQIVQSYEARNTNEFLRGIARNFAMED